MVIRSLNPNVLMNPIFCPLWGGYSLNLVLKVPKYHEDHKKIKFGAIGVAKDGGITIDAEKYRFRHLYKRKYGKSAQKCGFCSF